MRITESDIVNILCSEANITPERSAELILERLRARPKIVTLCGSTRFREWFERKQKSLTLAGQIVLTVGFFPHDDAKHDARRAGDKELQLGEVVARRLDDLHKRKIDISDYIFVINVDGYIGESTRSEIEYAVKLGMPVEYLEPVQ